MIARVESPPRVESRFSPAAIVLITIASIFAGLRLFEDPASPATAFRILMSGMAIGFVIFARRKSIMQRAAVFVGLEALGGLIAFFYVDVPFVLGHKVQIGALAVFLYRGMHGSH
jgi:hypothetical protein